MRHHAAVPWCLVDSSRDVIERYEALLKTRSHMKLFALVDGLGYEQLKGEHLQVGPGRYALFEGTPDAALSLVGPWLVDASQDDELRGHLLATQATTPYVSWLLAEMPLHGLVQLLQLRLDARLPDGGTALLRFYDPRVLKGLSLTLTPAQREEFFAHIHEWHFMCDGQALVIGRADA
jgi:Domain of unknown function (DUF4123)